MEYNKSSNPTLSGIERVHHSPTHGNKHMTIEGAYNKTLLLTFILIIFGYFGWTNATAIDFMPLLLITLVLGIGIAITLMFKPLWAPVLAPIYAIVEGYFLGVVSVFFELAYPGIVFQAILLTLAVALFMNILYRNKIIVVTAKFRSVIIMATLSIFAVYMISIVMSFFGTTIPLIHESGPIGILFSLVVVTIASLNLILDYDFIEKASQKKLPKQMEWYGAFVLIVTLVWLYLEILRFLAKLRSR
jgi:uncharacterized YccA/Bax inhibitor family protein